MFGQPGPLNPWKTHQAGGCSNSLHVPKKKSVGLKKDGEGHLGLSENRVYSQL